jgi:PBP1b-binding outer membrane lipoprotein LpoB
MKHFVTTAALIALFTVVLGGCSEASTTPKQETATGEMEKKPANAAKQVVAKPTDAASPTTN